MGTYFICTYCNFKADTHSHIIEHACDSHPTESIHFRKLTINPKTNKYGFRKISYTVIPAELKQQGKTVQSENEKLIIAEIHSDNTPHSKKNINKTRVSRTVT